MKTPRAIFAAACVLALCAGRAGAEREENLPPKLSADPWYGDELKLAYACDAGLERRLRERLAAMAVERRVDDADEWLRTLALAAYYPLDEAGPTLVRLYRAGGPREVRLIAEIAACYRNDTAETFQRTLLADRRLTSSHARLRLLLALAERGDAAAADSLASALVASESPAAVASSAAEAATAEANAYYIVSSARSAILRDRVALLPPPATRPSTRPSTSRPAATTMTTRSITLRTTNGTVSMPDLRKPSSQPIVVRNAADDAARRRLSVRRNLSMFLDANLLPPDALMNRIAHAHGWEQFDVAIALLSLAKCGAADDAERLVALPLGVNNVYAGYEDLTRLKLRTIELLRRRPSTRPTTGPTEGP